jgi:ATP-binding protein involved in chromosome partitioning
LKGMPKTYKDIVGDGGSNILAQVEAQLETVKRRLAAVRHKVAVASGKGGVGKSTVTATLASCLASWGVKVGVLDADIHGPAMAKMLGVRGQGLKVSPDGVEPVIGPWDIRLMSIDLLLPGDATPVAWKGPQGHAFVWQGTMEASTLREFLGDVRWGALDLLLVDLPPGPEALPTLFQLVPDLSGAVIVTTPSQVSQLVVGRFIASARELGVPIVGLLENMAGYVCPTCGQVGELFHGGDADSLAREWGIPHLGKIPFDPRLSGATDRGEPFLSRFSDSPAARAFTAVAENLRSLLEGGPR